jgi:hypothetical protein
MALDDFLSLDPINGIHASNSLNNVVPALRNEGSIGVSPAPSDRNYTEAAYFSVGALGAARTINYVIPLRLYKNSFFSMNKDIYYGITSYLRIYWDVINRICYMSDSNAGPSDGTPAVYTGNATITNLQLMLAVENSVAVAESIKSQYRNMSYMIPYVQSFKNPNSGGTQSISIQVDQGFGHTLQKVFHQVYNNTESLDTAYDCANNGTLIDGSTNAQANQKVLQYYTQLNGKREQDLTLDCTGAGGVFTDYLYMKRKIRKSMLQSLNIYQYNWVHCSDYTDINSKEVDNDGSLISGIPMSNAPITWTFYGQSMTNANYQHYDWFVFTRKMTFNGAGASLN